MKTRITESEARELRPYAFGYCEIQELLHLESPIYYTAGIYGRKADFYKIEDPDTLESYRISTGYGPIGKKTNYELTRKTEQTARKLENYSYQTKRRLLRKMIIKVIKGSE